MSASYACVVFLEFDFHCDGEAWFHTVKVNKICEYVPWRFKPSRKQSVGRFLNASLGFGPFKPRNNGAWNIIHYPTIHHNMSMICNFKGTFLQM